ncbi:hypothetical protein HJ588_14625 [Flexivirga sp. ID2601S]|uniref:Uncharacterized protein n=1 Tax=Flexivirga aerilata TaxID=1656889 RepID=A0A849AMB2_9MICO|nr:hypothetical protein [Flexivirga aerilata]NNG40501.1 hypothetical protein [Flexivirga aerilata]
MTHPGGGQQDPWQAPQGYPGQSQHQPQSYPGQPGQQPQQGYPGQPPQQQAPQGYPGQPHQPAPQAYPPAGAPGMPSGLIRLTLQGSPLTSNILTPKVQIDGYPVAVSYGVNTIPVPPGPHRVSAHATWIVRYGQASYDVDVAPGQTAEVYYAAPFVQFMKGAMGPTKQRRKGVSVLVALIVVVILLVTLIAVAGN